MKTFLKLSLIPFLVISPAQAADFDALVRASIDTHANATDYQSWRESGLTPTDVFAQSLGSPEKQAELCRALDRLTASDLEHFHSDLLEESLPCSTKLVSRIDKLARARDLELATNNPTRNENDSSPFILPGHEDLANPPRLNSTEIEIDPALGKTLFGTGSIGLLKPGQFVVTIDDGPRGTVTPQILETLQKFGVRANFFCEGENVAKVGRRGKKIGFELVQRMAAEGHIIGSHSMTHKNLKEEQYPISVQEIVNGHLQIIDALGMLAAPFFRYPYGSRTDKLDDYLHTLRMTAFKWNVDTLDWSFDNKHEIIAHFQKLLANRKLDRGIILIHDIHQRTADALPTMLQMLYNKGYETAVFVPKKTVLP